MCIPGVITFGRLAEWRKILIKTDTPLQLGGDSWAGGIESTRVPVLWDIHGRDRGLHIVFPWMSCCAPAHRERANKRCFCPSVRLSVAYIANNSRTQMPSVPKFGRKVPHLRCHSRTSFKVKRSKVRSPGPLMLTHIMGHIFWMARSTNFKLGIRMEDDESHQPQVPWPSRSKIKVTRSCNQSEPCWPNGPQIENVSPRLAGAGYPWHVLHCALVSSSKGQRSGSQAD